MKKLLLLLLLIPNLVMGEESPEDQWHSCRYEELKQINGLGLSVRDFEIG